MAIKQDFLIGARGWRHPHWQGFFYPEDLPHDWQLGFYSHEFYAVLVPVEDWLHSDDDIFDDWLDDVHEGFCFYFEWGQLAQEYLELSLKTLKKAKEVLQDQLVACVVMNSEPDIMSRISVLLPVVCHVNQRLNQSQSYSSNDLKTSEGADVLLMDAVDEDFRALRGFIEQTQTRKSSVIPALFMTNNQPSLGFLNQLMTLKNLMAL